MRYPERQENRKNPYYPAFDLLLAKLLAAEQALNVSEAAFGYASDSPAEWLGRIPDGRVCSILADICDDSISGYVKHVPSLREPDEETDFLLRAVRDFRTSSYLWVIARSFEAFREFVETIDVELPNATGSRGDRRVGSDDCSAEEKRTCFDDALRRVRRAAPLLAKCETQNARGIHLPQWISVVEVVRHAVAHSDGVLSDDEYKKYCSSGLERNFPGELQEDVGYVLKLTPDVAMKTIRTLREYALAIYKAVSEAMDLPAVIYDHDRGITTWRR